MFKLRNLITLAIIVIFGILLYNRFLGTPEEQQQSKETFQTIGKAFSDVGKSVGGLLKSEKEKYEAGKYDDALDKIGDLFQGLKQKAGELKDTGNGIMDTIKDLEEKKEALSNQIKSLEGKEMTDEASVEANQDLVKRFNELQEELKRINEQMDKSE